ncbi:MAG: phage holin family protein [Oscillospiraceae bacterium]|nr:phage holin family protein [Oscillospiraceae bacterium]
MSIPEIATVASVVVICYLIGMVIKASALDDKWIPICVGIAGGILGAVGMTVIPGYPADNIMDAIAVGIVSGLASTGANQIGKQLSK